MSLPFLVFSDTDWLQKNDPITLTEVGEVIPMIILQGWLQPVARDKYDKYLSGGNLHLITNDFRGKGRLKALWDITGYAVQEGMWTNPTITEIYLQQLAAFWSMKAPKELPTLPGIGGDGALYKRFNTPTHFWNSKYIETLQVKRIILGDEDRETPVSAKIVPTAVSKAPVITHQPWDPVLGDSVHAFAWWTLLKEEMTAVINDQKKQSSKRPASQIAESPPAPKGFTVPKGSVAKQPTTTSKTGAVPPKETPTAKTPIVKVPSVPIQGLDLTLPTVELSVPKVPQHPPPSGYRGNAGIREPSQVRGRKSTSGQGVRVPHAATAVVGKGTPPIPPEDGVGVAGVPTIPTPQETEGSTPDRSRSRDPPRETAAVASSAPQQITMDFPNYMIPLMASVGLGHLPTNIRDFFESFMQAQVAQDQVRAVQQSTQGLGDVPRLAGSPVSQEATGISVSAPAGVTVGRMPSPHMPATTAATESTGPVLPRVEESRDDSIQESTPADRGRRPSITEKVKSAFSWSSRRPLRGSDRRPQSLPPPPRPKAEALPKRSSSMPRLSESALTEPARSTPPSAPPQVTTVLPPVQIPAPTAAETATTTPVAEATSATSGIAWSDRE